MSTTIYYGSYSNTNGYSCINLTIYSNGSSKACGVQILFADDINGANEICYYSFTYIALNKFNEIYDIPKKFYKISYEFCDNSIHTLNISSQLLITKKIKSLQCNIHDNHIDLYGNIKNSYTNVLFQTDFSNTHKLLNSFCYDSSKNNICSRSIWVYKYI